MAYSGVGGWFNHPELSLQMIRLIFSPLAGDWRAVARDGGGSFIGQKLIINEFVA
ncbi:hypothetical protein MJ579_04380 [Klebsiella pneumoniae]|nr:hypothetical protein MJ579_04380 [Klebsiella pneumoniae]